MNKARKKTYKRGFAKRLVRESFVLSSTRYLSSRFVRIFESGFVSPLLTSANKVNRFAREKITGPLYKKIGIRKNFSMPARNALASFFANNPIMKSLASFRAAFLNTSVRSVGIFLLTFGIYAAAIFLLKSYVSLALGTEASIDDLSVAAVTALVGLLITAFGDRSILTALGNSRIIGSLLTNCLGVNESSLERYSSVSSGTAVAFGFLLGSLFGISTLFFTPACVLFFIAALLTCIAILNIPEFGLLLAASTFSFLPVGISAVVCAVSLISYLFKCVRLKRNFRFGTADAVVLIMLAVMFVSCFVSEGNASRGELYVLCFTAVYFLAKNLLCSETLVIQTLNALCTGANIGMALYILGDFATLIPHTHLRSAAIWLTSYTLDADMLLMLVSVTLPFALSSFSSVGGRRPREGFVLLAVVCAVLVDSLMFYVLLFVSFFVFVAVAYKAPVGALLASAVVIPPFTGLAFDYTLSSAVAFGVGTNYDSAFAASAEIQTFNYWSALYEVAGGIALVLFVGAVLLILQRVFGAMIGNNGTRSALFGGTAAASVINAVICSFIFNPFSDLRIYAVMWFVLGLCGAIYKVLTKPTAYETEV